MMNNYCQHIKLPFVLDCTKFSLDVKSKRIDDSFQHFDQNHVQDDIVGDFLDKLGLIRMHTESFWIPSGGCIPIHVDGLLDNKCKLNWIYGADGSKMHWYRLKDPHTKILQSQTSIGTPFLHVIPDQVDRVWSDEIQQPSLVNVGIFHSIENNTAEDRWSICILLGSKKTRSLIDWTTAKNILADFSI